MVKTYTFDDVVSTLNAVQPFDWAKFLNDRLRSTAAHAPLGGIVNGGYSLVYTAERPEIWKTSEDVRKMVNLSFSLGIETKATGEIIDVHLDSPAARAGLTPSTKIIAVNGREFSPAGLRHAVSDAVTEKNSIVFIVKDGEYFKTVNVDYHGGEKYPHLVRDNAKPDLIADIIKSHAGQGAGGPGN